MRVGVIDYGVGNLGSVMRALEELRSNPILVTRPSDLHLVDSIILPGVGNFTDCAQILYRDGWSDAIHEEASLKCKPLLGICLGMQLLATSGAEGARDNCANGTRGLGLIPGRVLELAVLGCSLRIPHVGWNEIKIQTSSGTLFDGIPDGTDFYFVHSYAFVAENPAHVLATSIYGVPVVAAVRRENVWGTQFHPEKSSRAGFRLLRNFIDSATC